MGAENHPTQGSSSGSGYYGASSHETPPYGSTPTQPVQPAVSYGALPAVGVQGGSGYVLHTSYIVPNHSRTVYASDPHLDTQSGTIPSGTYASRDGSIPVTGYAVAPHRQWLCMSLREDHLVGFYHLLVGHV